MISFGSVNCLILSLTCIPPIATSCQNLINHCLATTRLKYECWMILGYLHTTLTFRQVTLNKSPWICLEQMLYKLNQVVTRISVRYPSKISRHVAIRNIRKLSSVLINIIFLNISGITVYSSLLWEISWSNECINTLENRNGSWRIELLCKGFWGRGTVPGCRVTVSLVLCGSAYTYI